MASRSMHVVHSRTRHLGPVAQAVDFDALQQQQLLVRLAGTWGGASLVRKRQLNPHKYMSLGSVLVPLKQ